MLLVVDVGNTQTHFGTFRGDELVEHWRFATVRESTADELGAALRNLLALRGLSFADLDASIVSSTVPRPNRARWSGLCATGGRSIRRYSMPLSSSAFSTAAHGCEAGTA